jgi:hypothetical protein
MVDSEMDCGGAKGSGVNPATPPSKTPPMTPPSRLEALCKRSSRYKLFHPRRANTAFAADRQSRAPPALAEEREALPWEGNWRAKGKPKCLETRKLLYPGQGLTPTNPGPHAQLRRLGLGAVRERAWIAEVNKRHLSIAYWIFMVCPGRNSHWRHRSSITWTFGQHCY